jgi:type II secretion system protein D
MGCTAGGAAALSLLPQQKLNLWNAMPKLAACKHWPKVSGLIGLALAMSVQFTCAQQGGGPQLAQPTETAPPRTPAQTAQRPPGQPPLAAPQHSPQAASALPAIEQRLQLRQMTAEQFHARIEKAFGRPLPPMQDDGSGWLRFTINDGAGAQVLIAAHPKTGEVRLVGRPEQRRGWAQVVAALDSPAPRGSSDITQLIAADKAAAPKIKQTVGALLAQAQPQPRLGQQRQPSAPEQPAPRTDANAAGQDPNAIAPVAESEGLLGPVQIETIEGTDFFVVRGNPKDVEKVMEVIRQIEAMSRVSEPQVTVHPLKYVDAESMANLLARMFGPVPEGGFSLAPFYGSLLPLPLGNPNAVLLIGGPGTVAKAEELLQKLDVPGESMTQFEVFALKNANAEQALAVVERLFAVEQTQQTQPAPPLTPRAMAIAEPRTNSIIVRAGPRDMDAVRKLLAELDRPGGAKVNEIRVFPLKNALASELAPVLQRAVRGGGINDSSTDTLRGPAAQLRMVTIDAQGRQQLASGVLAGVTVNPDNRANALIVSAPPESMPLMAALIEQLDVAPSAAAQIKVFTIQNGDAVSLAEMLRGLFGIAGGGGNQPGGGGGQNAANQGNQIFSLRFEVDERTNSIIVAGSTDELLVVEAVLLRLDASESRTRVNRVYKLKNADAEQVAIALQEWLRQKREVEQTAPGVASPFQQIEREVVVVAEINSNSLIVSATPTYYQEITTIVQQLDEQAPMVMIQVLIGEVRLGDADEFGVEFGLQDSVLFDRSLIDPNGFVTTNSNVITQNAGGANTQVNQQIIQSAPLTPGFNFGDPARPLGNNGSTQSLATATRVGAQSLSSFSVGRVSPDLGFGGLVLSASSKSVSMLLRALQESRRLDILSRPQIMALDNQEGRTFVGEIVPIITSSTLTALGTPQNFTTPQAVGLELRVRPRISPEDLVVMEVSARKAELGPLDQGVPIAIAPNGDPIRVPRINSTEAQTTISAVSGQTVVLSGLLTKRNEELHRRVPLLADVPLVGDLFRYDSSRQVKTELLIILTPHVVRSRRDAEMLKQVESARMSWCLSDVVSLNGPSGLRSNTDVLGGAEAETVVPTGTLPEELLPPAGAAGPLPPAPGATPTIAPDALPPPPATMAP